MAVSNSWTKYLNVPGRGDASERDDTLGSQFELYANNNEVIPRSQWEELINTYDYSLMEKYVAKIKYQTMGSCASHSGTSTLEFVRNKAVGTENCVLLSPLSVFKFVGSRNGGSTLSGNMRRMSEVGALPLDTPENREKYGSHVWPENQWNGSLPSGWESTAALFRMTEWNEIGHSDEFVSALLQWKPVYYGRAGHAIYAVRLVKRNGKLMVKYANSWGDWGENGYGYDTIEYFANSVRSYGCYAPSSSLLLPEDSVT